MTATDIFARRSAHHNLEEMLMQQLFLQPLLYEFSFVAKTERGTEYRVTLEESGPSEIFEHYRNSRISHKGQQSIDYLGRPGTVTYNRHKLRGRIGYSISYNRLLIPVAHNPRNMRPTSRIAKAAFTTQLEFHS